MTVIADKGFGFKDNFSMLEEHNLKYIVPLRRNNSKFSLSSLAKSVSFDEHILLYIP